MSPVKKPVNLAASVRARLLAISKQQGMEFQRVLSDFAIERLLYRLGASRHADRFVLKGAMLFTLWQEDDRRATWDLDLLGRGASTVADVTVAIKDLCEIEADDGITFDAASVRGEDIRAADEYAGVRVRLEARLAEARIPMQVDVGFGDTVVPAARRESYPTLLDHASPRILAYPRETVVAEKLEAIVSLGVTNTRMKDFYDLYLLASSVEFDGRVLTRAVRATFNRRRTALPDGIPLALTPEFLAAPERQGAWRAFLRRGRLDAPPGAPEMAQALRGFLTPVLAVTAVGETWEAKWPPGGPWADTV